jgi:uncharacterized protein
MEIASARNDAPRNDGRCAASTSLPESAWRLCRVTLNLTWRQIMAGKFEIKKSNTGKFMFNLKAGNGKVILTSQLYRTKAAAQAGIESVKQHAADDANYERKTSTGGEPYFVLKAANRQIIGTSEMYNSKASMEKGIASVQAHAAEAAVSDMTA